MAAKQVVRQDPTQVFLGYYLVSGNVREAANKAGIEPALAYELRDQALEDETFATKRANIRQNILPDSEIMGFEQLQLLAEEIKNTPRTNPLEQEIRRQVGLKPLPDPRQKMIANLSRLIHVLNNIRRTTLDLNDDAPRGPVVIEVMPTGRAQRMLESA